MRQARNEISMIRQNVQNLDVFTTGQAAELLGYSDRTIRNYCEKGILKAARRGSRWLIRRDELKRYAALQGLKWPLATGVSAPIHDKFVRELIADDLAYDIRRFEGPFPRVWQYAYRVDDPSSGLRRIEEEDKVRWELHLATESEAGWELALSHMKTGLTGAYDAYREIKAKWVEYWQMLTVLEDLWKQQEAQELKSAAADVALNWGTFFRGILAEVDMQESHPDRTEYEKIAHPNGRIELRFKGSLLFSAVDDVNAEIWINWHLEKWRNFVREYFPRLRRLRSQIEEAAIKFRTVATRLSAGVDLTGYCDECQPGPSEEEPAGN